MSNPKNKWNQPAAPPAPMFFGKKERDLVKQVNDELAERVIGQTIAYYPISIEESNFNDTYGEAIEKVSLPPVRVFAFVDVDNEQTNERYGYEYQSKLTVNFHRRRLTEDQNLFVRVGDFLQYGDLFYEIVKLYNDTRYYFGQVEHKFQISAECVRARQGAFRVMPAVDRPGAVIRDQSEATSPAPRAAPYPPLAATYITVTPERKLPNERVLTAGSNIAFTDAGPNGALTVATTSELTASNMRVTGDLTLAGTLIGASPVQISGAVEIIDNTGTTIATLGSSSLGSDVLSASFGVLTNLSASGYISGSSFIGDGSQLTNLPVAAISSYTNPANNRVITSVDASTVTGEANLTFDGSLLTVTGDVTASANISASAFYGDGSTLTGIATSGGLFTAINSSNAYVTSSINIGSTATPTHPLTVIGASHLSGGLIHKRTAITNDYSIVLTDYYLGVDTTSNTVQLTIPAASTTTEGQTFVVKDEGGNVSSNAITIIRSDSDTIDGETSAAIESPYGALSLYTDGSNWFIY